MHQSWCWMIWHRQIPLWPKRIKKGYRRIVPRIAIFFEEHGWIMVNFIEFRLLIYQYMGVFNTCGISMNFCFVAVGFSLKLTRVMLFNGFNHLKWRSRKSSGHKSLVSNRAAKRVQGRLGHLSTLARLIPMYWMKWYMNMWNITIGDMKQKHTKATYITYKQIYLFTCFFHPSEWCWAYLVLPWIAGGPIS